MANSIEEEIKKALAEMDKLDKKIEEERKEVEKTIKLGEKVVKN